MNKCVDVSDTLKERRIREIILESFPELADMDERAMDFDVIAVDFDGTLCDDAWPDIGEEDKATISYILARQKEGAKIILWTNREGIYLERAVAWCKDRGLIFDAVNENLPEVEKAFGSDSRKIFANEYLDDLALKGAMYFAEWCGKHLVLREGVDV